MNFELYKELKDAGYPQQHGEMGGPSFSTSEGENILIPTLEELIEACGENIKSIDFLHDQNRVVVYSVDRTGIYDDGVTASEAVAQLWLALNKK